MLLKHLKGSNHVCSVGGVGLCLSDSNFCIEWHSHGPASVGHTLWPFVQHKQAFPSMGTGTGKPLFYVGPAKSYWRHTECLKVLGQMRRWWSHLPILARA